MSRRTRSEKPPTVTCVNHLLADLGLYACMQSMRLYGAYDAGMLHNYEIGRCHKPDACVLCSSVGPAACTVCCTIMYHKVSNIRAAPNACPVKQPSSGRPLCFAKYHEDPRKGAACRPMGAGQRLPNSTSRYFKLSNSQRHHGLMSAAMRQQKLAVRTPQHCVASAQ